MLISVMPKRAWSRLSIYAFVVSFNRQLLTASIFLPLLFILVNLLLEKKEKRPHTALPGLEINSKRKREKQ
jgi:hypothetical protein